MDGDPLPVFVFACVTCGKTVAGTEKTCPRCGASFENVKFECPFCGELVSPTERKCPTCNTEFGAFADEVSETACIDLDGSAASPPAEGQTQAAQEDVVGYECPNCGKPVSENDPKCPHCGVNFG